MEKLKESLDRDLILRLVCLLCNCSVIIASCSPELLASTTDRGANNSGPSTAAQCSHERINTSFRDKRKPETPTKRHSSAGINARENIFSRHVAAARLKYVIVITFPASSNFPV